MRLTSGLAVTILATAFAVPMLGGGTQKAVDSPIDISWTMGKEKSSDGDQDAILTSLKIISSKPVRGFVIFVQFWDGTTGARGNHVALRLWKPAKDGKPVYYAPGDVTSVLPLPLGRNKSGIPHKFKMKVDLAVFDDGSTWGLGRQPESQKLLEDIQAGH